MKLTAYQAYLEMPWTTPDDTCEYCSVKKLAEGAYVEGDLGHYCSEECLEEAESGEYEDPNYERKQMGITE